MSTERLPTNSSIEKSSLLVRAFSPGTKVVYNRSGQRILEGLIIKVEGMFATVQDEKSNVNEVRVNLHRLSDLNGGIVMVAKRKRSDEKKSA